MLKLSILILLYVKPIASILMKIYSTAWFQPIDINDHVVTLLAMPTIYACACQCLMNDLCVTGTFFGNNQTCVLFSSHLSQGQINIINDTLVKVYNFPEQPNPLNPPMSLQWLFDRNFNTIEGKYTGYLVTNDSNINETSESLWISPGYTGYGSAVSFSSDTYYVVDQLFDFTRISFTVTAWIWIPSNFSSAYADYFTLFTHCKRVKTDQCLHLVVGNGNLRLGFFNDDLVGISLLKPKQWYHVAYVYNKSTSTQFIYLNGNLDGSRISAALKTNSTFIRLGPIRSIQQTNYEDGYIDRLLFVSNARNASDILNEATLVAYYTFDNSFNDSGPNSINSTTQLSTAFYQNGRFNEALMINSSNTSYFQVSALYYLGLSNYSYSFSLWIYPFITNGTILQVSSSNNWSVPMIGFNKDGYLTIQTLSLYGIYSATYNYPLLPLNTWTHVCMTYSSTNGIRLFVNGLLVISNNVFTDYKASSDRCTITIGTSLNQNAQFHGMIDDLKIFSRELNSIEIQQFATL